MVGQASPTDVCSYIGEMRAEIGSKFHNVCHQCLDGWAEWKCVHVYEGEDEVGAER